MMVMVVMMIVMTLSSTKATEEMASVSEKEDGRKRQQTFMVMVMKMTVRGTHVGLSHSVRVSVHLSPHGLVVVLVVHSVLYLHALYRCLCQCVSVC